MADSYKSIARRATAEVVERKSRFIGVVEPVTSEEEAFEVLGAIRAAHPEARHNVWAYVLRDGRERCSDDGEPQKTAGLPTLEVLRRSGIVDVVAVTTRYFGGVLLGTGGLVRAYTVAVQESLAAAEVVEYTSCVDVACELPYALYEQVRHRALELGGKVVSTDFAASVAMRLLFKKGEERAFITEMGELGRGEPIARVAGERFCAF